MQHRIKRLRQALRENDLDAYLVLDRINTTYFTGFRCTYSMLLVDSRNAVFITDGRYAEAAEKALSGDFEVVIQPKQDVRGFLRGLFRKWAHRNIGFEGSITVDELERLRGFARGSRLVRDSAIPASLRAVKDEEELRHIRKAVRLSEKMMEHAFALARTGLREDELSRAIRFSSEELGGEGESFPNIVASGPNASRPHHHPGTRKLRDGDALKVDLGCIHRGYCSDLTRTAVLGRVPRGFDKIYDVCLRANREAIKALRPGITGKEVDSVAREVIASAGYGEYFTHGLGHGVGLEIHEGPYLSQAKGDDPLEPGHVITVEPGIYIPGKYGVRIEDYVVVTETGAQVLSRIPRDLTILPAT